MTRERDPHRQDRIMDAAEDLTVIWRDLGPMGRRMVNEYVGRDLYKALHALAIEVEGRVPLPESDDDVLTLIHRWGGEMYRLAAYDKAGKKDEAREASDLAGALMRQIKATLASTGVEPDDTNGAPGVTGFAPPGEIEEYPAERRVKDLESYLSARHVRENALHHARKAWPMMQEDASRQAAEVITIAQAFEKYLISAVEPEAAPEPGPPAVPMEPTFRQARLDVVTAAIAWAEMAHFANPSGLENWRNWSDVPDQDLINAVAVLTGRPTIESRKS